MRETKPTDCLICRKHRGALDVPGGAIHEDELLFVSHATVPEDRETQYLGYLFVEVKRHVAELGDLTEAEARAVGLLTTRAAKALMHTGMEHVYTFFIADAVRHVHVHVVGRHPGTPREHWGLRVLEWPQAPRGSARDIEQLAFRLRTFLASIPGADPQLA